jgi:hypothetical protein
MKKFLFCTGAALAIALYPGGAAAQSFERTATFTNSTMTDSGRCTVEVMVPGEARIRIHRDTAKLEHVSGRAPEWKRFECTGQMPKNPASFRVEMKEGRGHEEMVHGPAHNGGTAVVYINDPKHGEDTYSFDIVWGNTPPQH